MLRETGLRIRCGLGIPRPSPRLLPFGSCVSFSSFSSYCTSSPPAYTYSLAFLLILFLAWLCPFFLDTQRKMPSHHVHLSSFLLTPVCIGGRVPRPPPREANPMLLMYTLISSSEAILPTSISTVKNIGIPNM